jgi:hypothetical protein
MTANSSKTNDYNKRFSNFLLGFNAEKLYVPENIKSKQVLVTTIKR